MVSAIRQSLRRKGALGESSDELDVEALRRRLNANAIGVPNRLPIGRDERGSNRYPSRKAGNHNH
jgi:hypothetical protein